MENEIDYNENLAEAVEDFRLEHGRRYLDLFTDAIEGHCGTAIAEQARAIFREGEDMETQNSNALRYIADYFNDYNENNIADAIMAYINRNQKR